MLFVLFVPQGGQEVQEERELRMDTRQTAGMRSGKEDLKKHLRASASESWEPEDSQMEIDEKGDFDAHPQAKWKPIPPLLPDSLEHHIDPSAKTRNQSCQTEEQLEDGTPCSHHTGQFTLPHSELNFIHITKDKLIIKSDEHKQDSNR